MSDLDDIDLDPEDFKSSVPLKKVPHGDVFEASRAGDVDRLRYLLESGVNLNARDRWDSVPLFYACLAGHLDAARLLLESGAICSERTFDGDRCHYAALNLKVRKLLKSFEARPPPLRPLQAALRETFLGCRANSEFLEQLFDQGRAQFNPFSGNSLNNGHSSRNFLPDVAFLIQGRAIEAHKVILSARSPFFKKKFETDWKSKMEIKFSGEKLSYPALFSLIHFFYSDRLEISVDDMEDLVRICRVCKCHSLQKLLEKELVHQKYVDYKALRDLDNSQRRFILQGLSLPEEDRLPATLLRILQLSLSNSARAQNAEIAVVSLMHSHEFEDDLADVCVRVDKKIFRCHQVVLASRSDYFKARLLHMKDFLEGRDVLPNGTLPFLEEHDLSSEVFENILEYMYSDGITEVNPDQAEELFDASSRYLLFPLKRVVADALLPHLEMVSPAELCHWLLLSDIYGVLKLREYCLDAVACNFDTFAEIPEFRAMLLTLPPPSGDSTLRTSVPSAPGAEMNTVEGNLLDDLREKWLEAEAAELDKRDESALLFDKRLEMLVHIAEQEMSGIYGGSAEFGGESRTPFSFLSPK